MHPSCRRVAAGLIVLAVAAAGRAQAPPAASASMAPPAASEGDAPPLGSPEAINASLEKLSVTLAEMLVLFRRQTEQQEVALAVGRLQMGTFVTQDLRRRMDERRSEREALQDQVERMPPMMEEMSEDLARREKTATAEEREEIRETRTYFERMERELVSTREKLKQAELDFIDLENQAAASREDIARWQDLVDRYFDRRGK